MPDMKGTAARSKEDLIEKAEVLCELILFLNGDKTELTKWVRGRKAGVELIRGEGARGKLTVKVDKNLSFVRLSITGPSGRRLKLFV